jgi:hypothetical protein
MTTKSQIILEKREKNNQNKKSENEKKREK